METNQLQQAVENALIRTIQTGDCFKIPYELFFLLLSFLPLLTFSF